MTSKLKTSRCVLSCLPSRHLDQCQPTFRVPFIFHPKMQVFLPWRATLSCSVLYCTSLHCIALFCTLFECTLLLWLYLCLSVYLFFCLAVHMTVCLSFCFVSFFFNLCMRAHVCVYVCVRAYEYVCMCACARDCV